MSWEQIQSVRNLSLYSFAKYSVIFVPILASVIAYIVASTNTKVALPVNLLVLYLSSLMFVLAGLLTDFLCPPIIKEHLTFEKYNSCITQNAEALRAERAQRIERERGLLNEIVARYRNSKGKMKNRSNNDEGAGSILEFMMTDVTAETNVTKAQNLWVRENRETHKIVRCVIELLFILSGALAVYLTLYDAPKRVIAAIA